MNYYFILLLILIEITLLIFLTKKVPKLDENKKYFTIIFIFLVLFLVLRSPSVGVDTDNYKKIFEYCHEVDFLKLFTHGRHEVAYKYYCKFISTIYNNYSFFLMVTSVLSMIGVYYFIKDNSKNYLNSLLIFITFNFYGYFFGILRQSLAISILLYSLKFVKNRKLLKFLLAVFLASLFHKTALVFLPIYFVYNLKINKKIIITWAVFIGVFLIFKNVILNFIFEYIYKPESLEALSGDGYKMLILLFAVSIASYFYQDKLLKQDKNNQLFINMTFIATIIQVLATIFSTAYRVTLYYSFAIIIVIPNILKLIENKKLRIILTILMYLVLILYFYLMTTKLVNYVEYHFVFE
ncbi:MAG: EpsG family protein [Bacilli bacterium]|nr:EpsG family protein [Bacilli bacterium]